MNIPGLERIPTPRQQADQAIAETAARYGLSTDRVLVPCKKQRDVPSRHAVWLDLFCEQGWSTVTMGRRLRRNHATIIYGVRRAAHVRWGLPVTLSMADIRNAYLASLQVERAAA